MNFMLFCGITLVSAWVCSQVFKTLLNFCTTRTFKLKMLVSDGDFPSTHTTTSVTAVIILCYELLPIVFINSSTITMEVLFETIKILVQVIIVKIIFDAFIVIRDALGIRLSSHKTSNVLHEVLIGSPVSDNLQEFWCELAAKLDLKIGHFPHEVIGGLILGIIFGVGASSLRASNYLLFVIDIIVFTVYTIISFIVVGRKRKK